MAEWFGEAPSNQKACEETAVKNHCEIFHADDEDYFSKVAYWTTPARNAATTAERSARTTPSGSRLDADHALVARLPAAAVNPENHGQILRAVGRVHIQHLPFVRCRVRDIPCHTLGVCGGNERNGDEEEARDMFHAVHPTAVDRCALDFLTYKTALCLSIRAVRTPATAAHVHTLQGPELGPRSRR